MGPLDLFFVIITKILHIIENFNEILYCPSHPVWFFDPRSCLITIQIWNFDVEDLFRDLSGLQTSFGVNGFRRKKHLVNFRARSITLLHYPDRYPESSLPKNCQYGSHEKDVGKQVYWEKNLFWILYTSQMSNGAQGRTKDVCVVDLTCFAQSSSC